MNTETTISAHIIGKAGIKIVRVVDLVAIAAENGGSVPLEVLQGGGDAGECQVVIKGTAKGSREHRLSFGDPDEAKAWVQGYGYAHEERQETLAANREAREARLAAKPSIKLADAPPATEPEPEHDEAPPKKAAPKANGKSRAPSARRAAPTPKA